MKLSALYQSSTSGFPNYSDVDPLATVLCKRAPERLLWGSDWPHTGALDQPPDGAVLFDKLSVWTSSNETRRKILVDNPDRLFWKG